MPELTLQDLGEDEVIARLTSNFSRSERVIEGVGDDCAVVKPLREGEAQLLKTDAVVEGIHFTAEEIPQRVGWKAMARVVSDIASMGGLPDCALITLVAPKATAFERVKGIYEGLRNCAEAYGVSIVGGETTSGLQLLLSISMTGIVNEDQWVPRNQAKPGDAIFVTGRLGGSLRGHHLDFKPRLKEAQWLVKQFRPSSMMDLSDGLAKDLPRLAKASSVSFELNLEALPLNEFCSLQQGLQDGEDYELLFTVPAKELDALTSAWKAAFPSLALTQVGWIREFDETMTSKSESLQGGWDHYQNQSS